MAFLTLNAIEVPVLHESAERALLEIGEQSRAFDGSLRKSRQAVKRVLTLATPWLLATDALAYESLFLGLGHVWSFESSLYSSKGLGPTGTPTATQQAGTSKFGAGRLQITSGSSVVYAASLGSSWTVCFWRSTNSGSTWTHYAIRSDGAKWVNGSRSDATSTTFAAVSSGSLTLTSSGATTHFDDLVALPYLILDTWGPWLGVSATAWGDLPRLTAAGDGILTTSATVVGTIRDTKFAQGVMSGAMRANLQAISVALEEA